MQAWYKVVTAREEVRQGRSFNPDEFAIALEQVVEGRGPDDYSNPARFFARTYFTEALGQHVAMVLRRLAGETTNTSPVLTLVTQFGGGKTHTLTALYHLVNGGSAAITYPGIESLFRKQGLATVPTSRVGVFVGTAWDPSPGRETPWLDLARRLAGDAGAEALGPSAQTNPPGTDALARLFEAAGGSVLVLFDEVLNFFNRHRELADATYAFIQNLTVAMTGTARCAAVISLPRSQVEMTGYDIEWQQKVTRVVQRVAKDLIANDESEISEVIRRRLFENLGRQTDWREVALAYADWCFERRAQLPPEWTAVDTATTEATSRQLLRERFQASYPFHPATLSVFQRKWQALAQYQQTRTTLAMLAQWVALALKDSYQKAHTEPLLSLGSAPLEDAAFRAMVLGQLGEQRLAAAIESDIAGRNSHARALDADTKGTLKDIHRRVATTILFESSGGQTDKVAHLPELRFALGGPGLDTTSIDNAAAALEKRGFFIQPVGSDGYKLHHKATLKKVVSDRRASLDSETEVRPQIKRLVQQLFDKGARAPVEFFPEDGATVPDTPRMTLWVLSPDEEWTDEGAVRQKLAEWTRIRGSSPRLYPGGLVWCAKKPGRELRDRVELWLAWKRVAAEVAQGSLGTDYERADREDAALQARQSQEAAEEEVWASYRFVIVLDPQDTESDDHLRAIDLGAGHASAGGSLSDRVLEALRRESLLSEAVGAGYIDRKWPPTFRETGAWPLSGLRKSFLDGSLTRLTDPDASLRSRIAEFVQRGDFGLGSGQNPDGTYGRIWFQERPPVEDVSFEPDVFLLRKETAQRIRGESNLLTVGQVSAIETTTRESEHEEETRNGLSQTPPSAIEARPQLVQVVGVVPAELWNKAGIRLIARLRQTATALELRVDLRATYLAGTADTAQAEVRQALQDLGLADSIEVRVADLAESADGG